MIPRHDDSEDTIERCEKDSEHPYTMVLNSLIRDKSISPNCRMIIIFLLSNKDNWKIRIPHLVNEFKDHLGKDTIYKIVNEAIESGYMKREECTVNNLKRYRYKLSETPKFKKCFRHPDFQDTEPQDTENPDTKERTRKEIIKKQQHISIEICGSGKTAAVFSDQSNEKKMTSLQKNSESPIFEGLKPIDIPQIDKVEISKRYDENTVKNAIAWATNPQTKITKGLAPAIKWACRNKPEVPKKPVLEKNIDCAPYNRAYFREISKISHKNGIRLHTFVTEANDYIQTDNSKIYFKDSSFLEQVANFIRKKSIICQNIFDAITQCKNDLKRQQT